MTSRRLALTWICFAAAGGTVAWLGYFNHPNRGTCGYCNRPLRVNSMVTAEILGKRTHACCARCAISEANQQHKAFRLIEVHDYRSKNAISPTSAWFAEGSRVMACDHEMMRMDEHKDMQDLTFDRCSPGTIAFATKADADAFVAQNGGTVLSFDKLMSEAHFQ